MISGGRFCCSPHQNPLIIPADDDPTHTSLGAFTKSSSSLILIFRTFLPIPGLFSILVAPSTNENLFKQFKQAYLAAQITVLTASSGLPSSLDVGPQ